MIDTSDRDAKHISVHKCTPKSAGSYTSKIKNQAGEDETSIDVEVLDESNLPLDSVVLFATLTKFLLLKKFQ